MYSHFCLLTIYRDIMEIKKKRIITNSYMNTQALQIGQKLPVV